MSMSPSAIRQLIKQHDAYFQAWLKRQQLNEEKA
jgi:hypothetical protein